MQIGTFYHNKNIFGRGFKNFQQGKSLIQKNFLTTLIFYTSSFVVIESQKIKCLYFIEINFIGRKTERGGG